MQSLPIIAAAGETAFSPVPRKLEDGRGLPVPDLIFPAVPTLGKAMFTLSSPNRIRYHLGVELKSTSQAGVFICPAEPAKRSRVLLQGRQRFEHTEPYKWCLDPSTKLDRSMCRNLGKALRQELHKRAGYEPVHPLRVWADKLMSGFRFKGEKIFVGAHANPYGSKVLVPASGVWSGSAKFLRRAGLYQGDPAAESRPTRHQLCEEKELLLRSICIEGRIIAECFSILSGNKGLLRKLPSVDKLARRHRAADLDQLFAAVMSPLWRLVGANLAHLLPTDGTLFRLRVSMSIERDIFAQWGPAICADERVRADFAVETVKNALVIQIINEQTQAELAVVPLAFESGQHVIAFNPRGTQTFAQASEGLKPLETIVTRWPPDPKVRFVRQGAASFAEAPSA